MRDLVHTKKFDGRARAIAVQIMAGAVPTGSWLHAHGWKTDGLCECGAQDTLAHRLNGCAVRCGCPVKGVRSYRDFWDLFETPPLPRKIHEEGFALHVPDPQCESWDWSREKDSQTDPLSGPGGCVRPQAVWRWYKSMSNVNW